MGRPAQYHLPHLAILAIAGVVLKYTCAMPEILGFVFTMTRDNPYIPLPEGGSALRGIERARLLGNMRVRLGNVKTRT
jgi:hypothetical protein